MKRAIASVLALAMFLLLPAGCRQDKTPEPTPTAAPPVQTGTPAADEVVATVDGAEIMYSQLAEQMVTLEAMYSGLADQFTPEELREKLRAGAMTALENLIQDQILRTKIDEFGLTLTQDEQTEAEQAWEDAREKIRQSVQQMYPSLEGEDLETMTQAALESSGLSRDTVVANAEKALLAGKLNETVTADLPAPEESLIQTTYDSLLREQTADFPGQPTLFEAQALGRDPVVFVPETYRVLQEIYVRFDDDVIQLLREMRQFDTEDSDSYEKMLELEFQRLREEKLPELRRRLEEGVPFVQLMEEAKPGSSSTFNYVCEHTTRLPEEYFDAAMGIEAQGGVSRDEVRLEYGYAVLRWTDTLEPGARPLEQVRDEITAQLTAQARRDAWNDIRQSWRDEAQVEIFEDRLGY